MANEIARMARVFERMEKRQFDFIGRKLNIERNCYLGYIVQIKVVVEALNHFVLTVKSIDATANFTRRVLAVEIETFGEGRVALKIGSQKINLHEQGKEFLPKAHLPTPGAVDFCLITSASVAEVLERLKTCSVQIEQGPVERTGASGKMQSVYFRDPDLNLVEVSRYQ